VAVCDLAMVADRVVQRHRWQLPTHSAKKTRVDSYPLQTLGPASTPDAT